MLVFPPPQSKKKHAVLIPRNYSFFRDSKKTNDILTFLIHPDAGQEQITANYHLTTTIPKEKGKKENSHR